MGKCAVTDLRVRSLLRPPQLEVLDEPRLGFLQQMLQVPDLRLHLLQPRHDILVPTAQKSLLW